MAGNIQRCNFRPGDVIDGQYQVSRSLGEGTFGVVYRVTDSQGHDYALKLLRLWEVHPEIRDGLVQRFDMEYETGRIDSPYLVHSLGHGLVQGNPYIVMELCPGGDLITLSDKKELDLPTVAMHVLQGLKALHACGKVHRDLKPENVLLKQDGRYALTDFGIAGDRNKRMTERNILGKPKQIFGTYAYMPPEQLNPKRDATVLPTTDIFSFGVMMYQLITCELPFGQLDNEGDLVRYIKNGRQGRWNRLVLQHAADGHLWEELVEGCLEPDFQKRLQNVDDVIRICPQPKQEQQHRDAAIEVPQQPQFQTRIVNGLLLRVMQGEDYGRVFHLDHMLKGDRCILTLGRQDIGVENDISLAETDSCYVSRQHCTLELDYNQGCWIIRDGQWSRQTQGGWRDSTNGTYINSQEVTRRGTPVNPGDIISVGEVTLRAEGY